MPLYRLYGLAIRSPWRLGWTDAEVAESAGADLVVERAPSAAFAHVDRSLRAHADDTWNFLHQRLPDGSLYLRWGGRFEFLVGPGGTGVLGRSVGGAPLESFRSYLFSQVLSFALVERGVEPLHATTVVVDARGIGLMGAPGVGKSTLAAMFLREGAELLTDDLLVADRADGGFLAQPGPPRIKLFPDIAGRLLPRAAAGVPMNPVTPKVIIPLGRDRWHGGAVPLVRLYVLRTGGGTSGRISIRRTSPRRAFLELTRNTFNPVVVSAERLQRQLEMASALASGLPIETVSYPRDLARLPAVREAILRDLDR